MTLLRRRSVVAPLFLLANEFFDALPIRQFTRVGAGWAETVVGLAGEALTLGRAAPVQLGLLAHRLADTAEGDVVEVMPAAAPIAAAIGARIIALPARVRATQLDILRARAVLFDLDGTLGTFGGGYVLLRQDRKSVV